MTERQVIELVPVVDQLHDLLIIRVAWKDEFAGRTLPGMKEHSVWPEPGYPLGRKGLLLTSLWEHLCKPLSDGVIICDGDVVIDPSDYQALLAHVSTEPDAVWTAAVRLWPKATTLPEWVWAHRKNVDLSRTHEEICKDWQEDTDDPDMFSFCFTFLPRRLMEAAIKRGLKDKVYPGVDWFMWETAAEIGVPVRVVRGCYPRHLNY